MPELGQVVTRARIWLAAAVVGAAGTAVVFWFLNAISLSVNATMSATASLAVVVMLTMPVGLLAGTVATGVGGFVALWLGALAGAFAAATQYAHDSWSGLAAAIFVLVLPQAALPGYVVARLADRAISDRDWAVPARVAATFLIPCLVLFSVIGLIWITSGSSLVDPSP